MRRMGLLVMVMVISAYGFCDDLSNIRNPFQPRTSHVHLLESYLVDDFVLVGSVKQGMRLVAWIKTPTGIYLTLKLGDYVGMNKAKVVQIDDHQVVLKKDSSFNQYEYITMQGLAHA